MVMLQTPGVVTGLPALTDVLLVQTGPDEVAGVLPWLRPGSGLLVTGRDAVVAAAAARQSSGLPVLADRSRYRGAARAIAADPLDATWVQRQRRAGLTVPLTDSGYVPASDRRGLRTLLGNAGRLGSDVVCVLPLHRQWLARDAHHLVADINTAGVPVALVVEHRADPFSSLAVVQGLEHLLSHSTVPVLLLRSDMSALGAIAFGALGGAFGIRSALRHLYEQPKKPGGGRRVNGPLAALWLPGLYMVGVDRLATAHARTPYDPIWQCSCTVCNNQTLDWLHLTASPDQVLAHTLELVLDERDLLTQLPAGGPARRASWRAMCASAEFQFHQVAATTMRWTVPPAVANWQQV